MADRMTPEQVATLELPEGCSMYQAPSKIWLSEAGRLRDQSEYFTCRLAESVANGYLPRSVYDWAILAYRGGDVPTVEQWEAAERLAALTRNDAHPDSIVAKLANIIAPPKPAPLPEIEPCPYCGAHGDLVGGAVQCRARCNYVGPARDNAHDSIEAHNDVARKLRPEEKTEPRTCGGCRHWHRNGGCGHPNYWGGNIPTGTLKVLDRPASTGRDASECDGWEART